MNEQEETKVPRWKDKGWWSLVLSGLGVVVGILSIFVAVYGPFSQEEKQFMQWAGIVVIFFSIAIICSLLYVKWFKRKFDAERTKLNSQIGALQSGFNAERAKLKERANYLEKRVADIEKELEEARGYPVTDEHKLKEDVTRMLRDAKKSLYYYGGAGFIGDYEEWRECLSTKLDTHTGSKFRVVRLVDAKKPSEMFELIKRPCPKVDAILRSEISKYIAWLLNHARFLTVPFLDHNYFCDYEGSPIWKFGTHLMIFDEIHVVLVVAKDGYQGTENNADGTDKRPSYGVLRETIFLHNRGEFARTLVKSMDWLKENLAPRRTGDDLMRLIYDEESDRRHFHDFVEDVIHRYAMKQDDFKSLFTLGDLANIFPDDPFYEVLYK